MFTLDNLNKEWVKFVRANDGLRPTKLFLGKSELKYLESLDFSISFTNDEKGRAASLAYNHEERLKEFRAAPFGLELIKVGQESYFELK